MRGFAQRRVPLVGLLGLFLPNMLRKVLLTCALLMLTGIAIYAESDWELMGDN
jgi:hypothetical protein